MSQIDLNEKLLSNKIKLEVLENNDLLQLIDSYLKCRLCNTFTNCNDTFLCQTCDLDSINGFEMNNYGRFNIRYRF